MAQPEPRIIAVPTRQRLSEVRTDDDDWTGLTSPAERRRRQNRLHARAWRKRKAEAEQPGTASGLVLASSAGPSEPAEHGGSRASVLSDMNIGPPDPATLSLFRGDDGEPDGQDLPGDKQDVPLVSDPAPAPVPAGQWQLDVVHHHHHYHHLPPNPSQVQHYYHLPPNLSQLQHQSKHKDSHYSPYLSWLATGPQGRPPLIPPLIPYVTPDSGPTIPKPDLIFPLSPDHLFITIVQYNVLRGTITNMAILSLLDTLPMECSAALHVQTEYRNPGRGGTVPEALMPTELQRTVAHAPWIDTIPSPQLRDNLILLDGQYDPDELCSDVMGGLFEGFNEAAVRGWILWKEPWDARGWEVSAGFARKWAFLLRGCTSVKAATNAWRESRGEEPLVFEL
ncbi:hypothetical protein B0T24DRAFT_623697 [Lasiosphaeria ovina]|uniref:BZIP domain-containing protein n=1 Tax=Lasiosphaeria ovina TaxID=92902 RepID=A0AAE0KB33_9PEZI|nr:hypothetical protein B0T24DRAFT_623697 [Lasiosphaeria ovina]